MFVIFDHFKSHFDHFRAKNVLECTGTFLAFVKNTGTFPVHSGTFLRNFIPGKSGRFSENFRPSIIFDFRLSGIVESRKFPANAWP